MMCDTIMAADNAKFAQPEVKLGIISGAGGTQRLPRAVSKAKAMDLALTGRMMDAAEAERSGLVARIFPQADLLKEVKAIAKGIADMPLLTAMMVKESINTAYETTLSEGIHFERRLFYAYLVCMIRKRVWLRLWKNVQPNLRILKNGYLKEFSFFPASVELV